MGCSELTSLWGPPGTGKTYTIALLVASAQTAGETILVTSHTHAAVEQALWAAVEPPTEGRPGGLLHDSPHVHEGRVLKVGPIRQQRIPLECHLDSHLEARAQRQHDELAGLLATPKLASGDPARLRCLPTRT